MFESRDVRGQEKVTEFTVETAHALNLKPGMRARPIRIVVSHLRDIRVKQYDTAGYVGETIETTRSYDGLSCGPSYQWSTPETVPDPTL